MKQSNTITALVITGWKTNWGRHYLKDVGFNATQVKSIMFWITDNKHITGDIKICEFVLNGIERR